MSTLPSSAHEQPAPLGPVLVLIAAVALGAYLLLGALALAERANGRWGLGLLPLVLVCFAVAGREAYVLTRRRS